MHIQLSCFHSRSDSRFGSMICCKLQDLLVGISSIFVKIGNHIFFESELWTEFNSEQKLFRNWRSLSFHDDLTLTYFDTHAEVHFVQPDELLFIIYHDNLVMTHPDEEACSNCVSIENAERGHIQSQYPGHQRIQHQS